MWEKTYLIIPCSTNFCRSVRGHGTSTGCMLSGSYHGAAGSKISFLILMMNTSATDIERKIIIFAVFCRAPLPSVWKFYSFTNLMQISDTNLIITMFYCKRTLDRRSNWCNTIISCKINVLTLFYMHSLH